MPEGKPSRLDYQGDDSLATALGSGKAQFLHSVAAQRRIEMFGRLWHGRWVRRNGRRLCGDATYQGYPHRSVEETCGWRDRASSLRVAPPGSLPSGFSISHGFASRSGSFPRPHHSPIFPPVTSMRAHASLNPGVWGSAPKSFTRTGATPGARVRLQLSPAATPKFVRRYSG